MKFKKWLETFLEEKGVCDEEMFEFKHNQDTHIFDYGYIKTAILLSSKEEQKLIKSKLAMIDFCNGDVKKFLRYLARALV